MALTVGDASATQGVSMIVYTAIDAVLRPPMVQSMTSSSPPATPAQIATAVASAQANWRNLAYAVAGGLVTSLTQVPAASPQPPTPVFAQTLSSGAQDAFWPWLAGFVKVFTTTWVPATADGVALQTALKAFLATSVGTAPNTVTGVPTQLKGILQ